MDINILINKIEEWYPAKESITNNSTSYPNINKIVESKINSLQAGELLPGSKICNTIEKEFEPIRVENFLYTQFPNYAITLNLHEQKGDYLESICQLKIRISLLTNHFTLFYEEFIRVYKIGSPDKDSILIPDYKKTSEQCKAVSFISSNNEFVDPGKSMFNKIAEIIKHALPNYNLVNAEPLFKTVYANCIPYKTAAYQKEFPIYSFLFGVNHVVPVIL